MSVCNLPQLSPTMTLLVYVSGGLLTLLSLLIIVKLCTPSNDPIKRLEEKTKMYK
uniref:ATP synthase F0 subunit 8 n=1 Tax=Meghimatium bilineatum TaxID=318265 RepID=A0A218KBN5_9EUPU|nr:ATP synthase F0 subunit 8 [Meghimatium bilineatum]AKK32348.1 ATP synthase F0 subunit 8 [Meghimatium bilineatum]